MEFANTANPARDGIPNFLKYGSGKRAAQHRPCVLYAGVGVTSVIQRNDPASQSERKTNLHEKRRVISCQRPSRSTLSSLLMTRHFPSILYAFSITTS